MKTPFKRFLLVLTALAAGSVASVYPQTNQQPQKFSTRITKTVSTEYLLYLPTDYNTDKKKRWPLVLFLHGAGERGSDLNKVKIHGPPKLVAAGREFPFILVSPQCADRRWWDADVLDALLGDISKRYRVDKTRVYCTGLSMGGFGTWELAAAHPSRFAAIAPICGGGDPTTVARFKDIPAWVFHGAKDPVVKPEESRKMVDAIEKAGGNVKLTIYPDADHDSWTRTYDNSEFYDWLLSQRRK